MTKELMVWAREQLDKEEADASHRNPTTSPHQSSDPPTTAPSPPAPASSSPDLDRKFGRRGEAPPPGTTSGEEVVKTEWNWASTYVGEGGG